MQKHALVRYPVLFVLIALLSGPLAFCCENTAIDPTTDDVVNEAYAAIQRIASSDPKPLKALNRPQRQHLAQLTYNNAIARLDRIAEFDVTGGIGYCFGRAMAAHLIARRMGLVEESIRKLFVIGPLKENWRFHVTTLVLGTNGEWHAIDPISYWFGHPIATAITEKQWVVGVSKRLVNNNQANFLVTPATVVLPDLRYVPEYYPKTDPLHKFNEETGKLVVEVSFEPSLKTPDNPEGEFTLYRELDLQIPQPIEVDLVLADLKTSTKYFTARDEPPRNDRFDFTGLVVNTKYKGEPVEAKYEYRGIHKEHLKGYFAQLLKDILLAPPERFEVPEEVELTRAGKTLREGAANRLASKELPPLGFKLLPPKQAEER